MTQFFQKYRKDINALLFLLLMLVLARLTFIFCMPATYSKDLYAWLRVIDILHHGGNPYAQTSVLNWPPFWMQLLYGIGFLSRLLSVSAIHLIQALLIVFEAINLVLVYGILKVFFNKESITKVLLFGLALNPVCVFLSCQHCNFDIIVGTWILLVTLTVLAFYRTQSSTTWLMACLFAGMGILTKTIPVILIPILVISSQKQTLATRILGLMLLLVPVCVGMSVIFAMAPGGVLQNVLGYRSMSGWYGITGLLEMAHISAIIVLYSVLSPLVFILFMYFTARKYSGIKLSAKQIVTLTALLVLFIPTFGPGYSPPYICWFLSLMILLFAIGSSQLKKVLIAGYFIIIITYLVEYALFDSHGAYLMHMHPTAQIVALCQSVSSSTAQVLIRLPMFIYYIMLFFSIAKELKTDAAIKVENPELLSPIPGTQ